MSITAPRPQAQGTRKRRRRATLALLASVLWAGAGCGREFYRNWADQDVSEAVFEKTRDPRWRMDLFTIEPPSMSRFADPYDPDRPPAPPDDRAAEALSPVPQWPHHRLLVPQEGTGYLEMLSDWQGEREALAAANPDYAGRLPGSNTPEDLQPPRPLDLPPAEGTSPFGPASPEASPPPPPAPATPESSLPASAGMTQPVNSTGVMPALRPPATALARPTAPARSQVAANQEKQGVSGPPMSPTSSGVAPANSAMAASRPAAAGLQTAASSTPLGRPLQDDALSRSALQDPPSQPTLPAAPPGAPASAQPVQLPEGMVPNPSAVDPNADPTLPPRIDMDPDPVDVDLTMPANPREPALGGSGGLSALLSPTKLPFDHEEAAALPKGSNPYLITPAQAMTLGLINSRAYQTQVEEIYLRALDVTLQRWGFEPQFIAGMSPQTGTSAGSPGPNFQNSYLYRTQEVLGGQNSTLSIGTLAGMGKVFNFGGQFLAGFANQVVFNFTGANPIQPSVQSILPLSFSQAFLRGGGRAVTMEPLTLAERNLLYQVRAFARFRQTFMPSVLTSNTQLNFGGAAGGGADQAVGFLQILQIAQQVENNRKTVAAFEKLLGGYNEMSRGGGSGVSQLNVQDVDSNLQSARQSLIQSITNYRTSLDQYKIQLGLPPDVPIVLDRYLTEGFQDVFDEIDDWFLEEDRDPADLPELVSHLPKLPDVLLDGLGALRDGTDPFRQEEVLLAAERIALENRFDLMNTRAQLYDDWRQLAVRANALKGVFTARVNNQVYTPSNTTNPFGFSDQASQFNLTFNAELPLVRLNERNLYRTSLITYRRGQRDLMALEDQTKLAVRTRIRNLILQNESFEIQRRQLIVNLSRKDNSQRTIFAPPGPGDTGGGQITATTQQLVQSQNQLLSAQNGLIQIWVQYITNRINLYSDLGIIPYDEWEAYHELFPSSTARTDRDADEPADRDAAAPAIEPAAVGT